jgi:hypothetical protein
MSEADDPPVDRDAAAEPNPAGGTPDVRDGLDELLKAMREASDKRSAAPAPSVVHPESHQ